MMGPTGPNEIKSIKINQRYAHFQILCVVLMCLCFIHFVEILNLDYVKALYYR